MTHLMTAHQDRAGKTGGGAVKTGAAPDFYPLGTFRAEAGSQ